MSIFAYNDEVLAVFNDLLHDLYWEVPNSRFSPTNGKLELTFWDQDHVIDRQRIYRFRLQVHEVVEVNNIGRIEDLPGGEIELNRIKFDRKRNIVVFQNVHPYEVRCRVKELKLELDQID